MPCAYRPWPASCIVDQSDSMPIVVVAGRQPDVARRERRAERVHGRVEAPRAVLEADRREDALGELSLECLRVRHVEERRVDLRRLAHELRQHRLDRVEDLRDLGRLHERLVVVEQRRVRRVVPLEALDVAALQLEVLLERGEERLEVVFARALDPDVMTPRAGAHHLGAQLGGDAALLLPVAPGDADEARVVGVVLERLLVAAAAARAASRPRRRRTSRARSGRSSPIASARAGAAERRHRHALVPAQDAACAA